jgi:hypothetical protein
MKRFSLLAAMLLAAISSADGPTDNKPESVRPIPPPGLPVDPKTKMDLIAAADRLDADLKALIASPRDGGRSARFAPDVLIFSKAVRVALVNNEIYAQNELGVARELLAMGRRRLEELAAGTPRWNTQTGLVVRGFVSEIDGSVQPYGLVVPATHRADSAQKSRLDIWLHGRGEKLTELAFLDQRRKQPGEFTPPGAIVLHPYGRYCNAFRFAGETDVFEALADVKKRYRIDDDRIVMRGFSMGGAGCWQFATHHSGLWAAAAPGAGFSETADFLKVFQNEKIQPTWYEQKLWNLYDSTTYARNILNVPTVAYSGELDRQKQAADQMAAALWKEGMTLTHIIGPRTAHRYEPKSKDEVNRRIDRLAERGRVQSLRRIDLVTYTLKYNRVRWFVVDGLDRHWEKANVIANVYDGLFNILVQGISAFSLHFESGEFTPTIHTEFKVNSQRVEPLRFDRIEWNRRSDGSFDLSFEKKDGVWRLAPSPPSGKVKRHGLQGPIDDAFMGPFAFVRPTGKPRSEVVGKWVEREMNRAIDQWRRQFRGEPIVVDDVKVTDKLIAERSLVLWGDPQSNSVFGRIAKELPLAWDDKGVKIGQAAGGPTSVPIMIYPNPLNGDRYVVLNSSFTFREYDYLSNARQTPKLPDWAVIDASTPMTSRAPGKIVDAGFFDEKWEWKARN